jgi:hypothetical protein
MPVWLKPDIPRSAGINAVTDGKNLPEIDVSEGQMKSGA